MTVNLIDVFGLTTTGDGRVVADALGLSGEMITDRLLTLAQLREGWGFVVYTGPESRWFWAAVSPEVKVRVVPDDYEFSDRLPPDSLWAYRAVGVATTAAGQLVKRKTAVPVGHRWYSHWVAGRQLLADLGAVGRVEPRVNAEYRIEQWGVDNGLAFLQSQDFKALDYEWDIETNEPAGLALADSEVAAYVPVLASDLGPAIRSSSERSRRSNPRESLRLPIQSDDPGLRLREAVSSYLLSGKPAVMHGGRADIGTQFLGDPLDLVGVADLDDTMVMAYLCGEPVLALKDLTRKYLDRDPTDFPGNLSELPSALGTRYAAADARNTYDLFSVFGRVLAAREQLEVYRDIERPLVPLIASMERYGVPLDLGEVKRLYRDTVAVEQGVRYAIKQHYGWDVARDTDLGVGGNQARAFVTDVVGYDPGTLDQRVLTMFPQGEIDLLLLHRRSRTLRRNFLGRALRYMHAATHPHRIGSLFKSKKRFTAKGELTDLGKFLDWRQHWTQSGSGQFRYFPRFNQAGSMDGENRAAPRSGRLSSSGDINFQQQSRLMRKIYVPPAGHDWWSWDYSGLELHIAAAISGDPVMMQVLMEQCPAPTAKGCEHFPKHGDLHSSLQYKVWEITGEKLPRAEVIKPANFEQLYGGGAGKLVEIVAKGRTYITVETAKSVIAGHEQLFAGFWGYREQRVLENRRRGYAETLFHRRRYIPEYRSNDPDCRADADRAGANHEIQGTAADIVKIAMNTVVPILRKYGAHMCAQVHDELDAWAPSGISNDFGLEVAEAMTSIELPNGLKLKVEWGRGKSWAEAH